MALCNGRINLYRYKRERSFYVSYSRPLLFPFTLYCLFFNLNITIFTLTHACDFAWKIVPLWYQQQLKKSDTYKKACCDLLEKSYLCGINNNILKPKTIAKALWFAWKIVPLWYQQQPQKEKEAVKSVVICLKNRTFVVSTTTLFFINKILLGLWFAWKIVPLWYQQQP